MKARALPAKRGDIYDKNGNILATSNKVYNVILDCKTVNSDEDYVEPTIKCSYGAYLDWRRREIRSLLSDCRKYQSESVSDCDQAAFHGR